MFVYAMAFLACWFIVMLIILAAANFSDSPEAISLGKTVKGTRVSGSLKNGKCQICSGNCGQCGSSHE